jgi:beta-glucosidase
MHFVDAKPHAIVVEYAHEAPLFGGGITMEWVPPAGMLQAEAVKLAKEADLVIAMVGLSPELEGEEMKVSAEGFAGGDRTDIVLPASQRKMLEDVAATGKPMIVVLLNGSALAVNWVKDHANALLEAWYPGEYGGEAIAETLTGKNNPAGRLPVTFYKSVADLPAFTDYAMKNRTYRYFDGSPLYGFGYGLSYTHFTYSRLKLSTTDLEAGNDLIAEVDLRNDGKHEGDEVAEVYLLPPVTGNDGLSPKQQLLGFQRVALKAGESRHLRFTLTPRNLSEVDGKGERSVQAGNYKLAIGGGQPDDALAATPAQTLTFTVHGSAQLPR